MRVHEWDYERKTSIVKNPLKCIVGCSNCANACPIEAIFFPPREILQSFGKS